MHLYSVLLCIAVHLKRFTIMCVCGGGGVSLLNHHQCVASTWMMQRLPQDNGASALTTHQLQVEKRESHRENLIYGDYYKAMIDKDQWWEFGQDTGVTLLLFTWSAMGFLMTTESQVLGLTSHPKDDIYIYIYIYYNPCLNICLSLLKHLVYSYSKNIIMEF